MTDTDTSVNTEVTQTPNN